MDHSEEQWKDIPGYEGLYQASSLGRIRSKSRGGIIKKQAKKRRGNMNVNLSKDGVKKTLSVHRLIYAAFKGEIKNAIDHIDENPSNNNIENLQDITIRENTIKSVKSKTGSVGIYYRKERGVWETRISYNGVQRLIGHYATKEKAQAAYNRALYRINLGLSPAKNYKQLVKWDNSAR